MFTSIRMPAKKRSGPISPIEECIADIKAGKMVILMDDENRENEGDICIAAEKVTAEHINFMAKHARGLICLSLTEEKIRELGLSMMVADNRAPLGTAFTVSIDARHGITAGVSAADRAHTVRLAVREGTRPEDLATPGHIFPLRARRGGVLVRTGQTEGGVDLARLAGLAPAAVICEIMNDDGTMSRLGDLERFAKEHKIKICTVADLVQYRLRCDSLVHRAGKAKLNTRYGGEFTCYAYHSDVDDGEHLVLVKGEIKRNEPTLVRAHAEFLPGDVFALTHRNTGALLHRAMETIAAEGKGVILYLRRDGRGAELKELKRRGTDDAKRPSTDPTTQRMDFREYGVGAQILHDVGLGKIRLMTNYPRRLVSLPGYGLEIVECVPLKLDEKVPPTLKSGPKSKTTPLRRGRSTARS